VFRLLNQPITAALFVRLLKFSFDSCLSSGAIQSLAVGGMNNRATFVDAHNTRDPSAHGMSLDEDAG
jgi:hypothetical protein